MVTRVELVSRLERAFLDHGYEHLTMTGLAKAVDVTRRTLYNYFSSKEQAFRFLIENVNAQAVEIGMAAGREALADGRDAAEILTVILDTRYGNTRRRLATSPHAFEINDQAFRRCRDIMIASAVGFQSELARFIGELEGESLLRVKPDVGAETLAQLLADGARGTNQSLPPIDPAKLHQRYRDMVRALLHGATQLAI
ncbi:TetR/AcrR family transcriptional regulator [Bosea sp. LjRoot237]|uniref:TetR/AcrR family transcriptional regulator n=1 Tax=Bosea sp. LjRoot237 TaxID=3342292 RepID=UPI003ED03930